MVAERAKAIVRKSLDDLFMEEFWTEPRFSLSLDQSLVVAMEDEAQWMIKNNLTRQKTVPEFLNFIYEDALKEIKPDAIIIMR
jgi:hypothetical protein